MRQHLQTLRWALPPGIRLPIERALDGLVPLPRRLGNGYWSLRKFLQEAQWWDRARIEAWQTERLREVVRHAKASVPGYSLLYADAGVGPEDIRRPEDIRLLPTVDKVLLRDNLKDFTATDIPYRHMHYLSTSGSTGIPFGFYQLESNVWIERAFIHLGWERSGWRPGDRSARAARRTHGLARDLLERRRAEPCSFTSRPIISTWLAAPHTSAEWRNFRAVALQAYPPWRPGWLT